mmetsp:Transcript_22392/g.33133  ORF Transcript_22392/g.33133 Transcript_22392/m.33133 type:complete len:270 (-) Transcript_22392:110-919(-)
MGRLKKKELAAALSNLTITNEFGTTIPTKKESEQLVHQVLADAFVQDPLMRWMGHVPSESSPSNTSSTPSPSSPDMLDHRRKIMLNLNQYIFKMISSLSRKNGAILVVKDKKDGSISGVMCVMAPAAATKKFTLNWLLYALRRGLPPTHASSTKSDYGKMAEKRFEYFDIIIKRRKELMETNTNWICLQTLGVHTSHQGQGVGGRLLRSLVSAADSLHAHVYLETESVENEALYKHFGFRTLELFQMCVPGDVSQDANFTMYLMIRDPQ